MAKIRTGAIVGQISGSTGGIVFAHNSGGAYIRNRGIPDKFTTSKALTAKDLLAYLSDLWSTLGDPNRSAWTEYARQHPVVDTLGEKRPLTGHQMFVSCSTRLARAGGTISFTPPATVTPEPLATLGLTNVHAGAVTMTFTTTPSPATTALWVNACMYNSAGRSYVKNTLAFMKAYTGAVTSPKVITTDFIALCGASKVGQKATIEVMVVDTTSGLASVPLRANTIVT